MGFFRRDYIFGLGMQAHPPLSFSLASSSSPSLSSSSSDSNFPIVILAILGIVCTSLLLLSYYLFVTKCCLNWQQFSILRRFSTSQGHGEEDRFMAAYSSAIGNLGLGESVIRAIPIFQFKGALVGGGYNDEENTHECAVCLNEFLQDERLRLLPNCAHAFHIDCIDTWLQNNVNCPLCRSSISKTTPFLPQQPMVQNPSQDSHQTNHCLAGGDANVVIEVGSDGTDQTTTGEDMRTPAEAPSQSKTVYKNSCPGKTEQRTLSKKMRRFSHVSSMGDEYIDVRGEDDQFSVNPVRRSLSMDFSVDCQLYLSVQEILEQNPHSREVGSSNGGGNSSRIRRSLFSLGYCQGTRNSVIPIQFDP